MNVQCTTAELPSLLPMLAGLNKAFHLTVTDAPVESVTVAAKPVAKAATSGEVAQPASTAAVTSTAKEPRWYSSEEVRGLFKYKSIQSAIDLMKRAGIEAIRVRQNGHRGQIPYYYDADKVDALKRDFDDTWSVQDAADLMGDKSTVPIQYHTERRRITPTIVAGQTRYKTEDLHELMRYRKIA